MREKCINLVLIYLEPYNIKFVSPAILTELTKDEAYWAIRENSLTMTERYFLFRTDRVITHGSLATLVL